MQQYLQPVIPLDTSVTSPCSIPQLKVVFCGSVCETAPIYTDPSQVAALMADDMRHLDREAFYVLHLNGKNQIISKELISLGSLNQSIVHPREVFKGVLLNNSASIICVHNHPSGNPAPSFEDKSITRRLRDCADLFCIKFLDHVIISFAVTGIEQLQYFSFAQNFWPCGVSVQQEVMEQQENKKCDWLIDLRKQVGITQKHLAVLSGLRHQAVISEMERGWREVDEATEKILRETLKAIAPQPC